ncbi:acyl-CoA thioesterase [Natrinema versiforme]|uniref:Thioesterase superfamily protein n=1 Tax=Natrinema versiforme JCM 10478 TaxID=1227496 RepID=L9YBE5_9EURY|nr:thioesterase family protein [Natrinema versiforme]ELY70243.1 thioesterase superfamily protein [Natrinema versiforme JCM 10478]
MSAEFTVDVSVRYRDLDPLNHVNHAVYASYLEVARTAYLEEVVDVAAEDISFVLANLEISYERPITMGDDPTVAVSVSRLGDSSCTMAYEIRVDGDIAATAETTMVHIDPETRRPSSIPDPMAQRIRNREELEAAA